mmetsp:Transcript_27779/g.90896  ORF Transcript_27779/g.90896 Transcript_27779/m.90896 type:complete len:292 (-) Transcript_27779:10-885(-)
MCWSIPSLECRFEARCVREHVRPRVSTCACAQVQPRRPNLRLRLRAPTREIGGKREPSRRPRRLWGADGMGVQELSTYAHAPARFMPERGDVARLQPQRQNARDGGRGRDGSPLRPQRPLPNYGLGRAQRSRHRPRVWTPAKLHLHCRQRWSFGGVVAAESPHEAAEHGCEQLRELRPAAPDGDCGRLARRRLAPELRHERGGARRHSLQPGQPRREPAPRPRRPRRLRRLAPAPAHLHHRLGGPHHPRLGPHAHRRPSTRRRLPEKPREDQRRLVVVNTRTTAKVREAIR